MHVLGTLRRCLPRGCAGTDARFRNGLLHARRRDLGPSPPRTGAHTRTLHPLKIRMELRKDPITQSWVILGQREARGDTPVECPLEPAKIGKLRSILTWPAEGAWQVRGLPHPEPLDHIEGEPGRLAEGMYAKMGALGAHEVVVETPLHDKRMSQFSDEEIERVLWVWASRIAALKKDARFKDISVFNNQGAMAVAEAGQG